MKKHPIDDLFNQQLKDFEASASEDLRKRFLQQLEEKQEQKKGGFIVWRPYFAAAASMALILGIGWSLYNLNTGKPADSSPQLAKAPAGTVQTEPSAEQLAAELPLTEKPEEQLAAVQPIPKKEAPAEQKKSNIQANTELPKNLAKAEPIRPKMAASGVMELDERIPDELTLALENSVRKEKQQARQATKTKNGIFTKSAGETIIIVASDFEKEEQIYLPEINEDSPITMAEATEIGEDKMGIDKAFISKVFTEIKHFKHGEKVTLDKIDEHIEVAYNEDTFIGHEAMELRQKVNWLKDKLSK